MDNSTIATGSQMHPDKARANLGIITQLLQHNVPQAPPEAPQTPPQPQGEAETPKEDKQPTEEKEPQKDPMKEMELMFTTKLDEIRQELKADNQREIDTLKKTITDALAEDDTNEPNKTA